MIKIIYNSPAIPQKHYNFNLDQEYELNKIKGKYVISLNYGDKREFDIDFIKSMFKPCEGYSWDMLEKENKENIEVKNTSKTKLNNTKQNKKIKNGGV